MESHKRSIAKSITFRIIATFTTFIFVYLITGNLVLSGTIGGIDLVSKLILYYVHERIWMKVKWGRN